MAPRQGGPRGFELVDLPADEEEGSAQPAEKPGPIGDVPMSFATLVLSLSTSVLMHLGVLPSDEGEEPQNTPVNLPLAKQTIGILEMLQEKTAGNLDQEEARMLEQLLHDLHMRFVEAKQD